MTEPSASICVEHRAMHLVTLLLPLARNDGSPQPREHFAAVRAELVERFGGATFYGRAAADGLWRDEAGEVERDQLVVVEVVDEAFDRRSWSEYRQALEQRFGQAELMIRATAIEQP